MAELTLEESLRQILPTLPLPIQKFFEQRKLGETARILMERYALHVDQGAILERELMLLLLGLENPEQFAEALYAELPISKQTVRDIITDVNELVFVPLREEMRKGQPAEVKPPQAQSAAASAPRPTEASGVVWPPRASVLQPRTTIIPANPQMPPRAPQVLAPTSSYAPKPPSRPSINLVADSGERSALREALNAVTMGPKQVAPNRMLEDHEEPHIEFHHPSLKAMAGAAKTAPPPPNLPGAIYHPPIPKPPIAPIPSASAKPYSSDPYREPIE